MNNAISAALAIVGGVIGLAIISVLVSKQAQTPQVFGAAGSALSSVIAAAVSPVTGTGSGASAGASSGGITSLLGNFSPSALGGLGSLFGG